MRRVGEFIRDAHALPLASFRAKHGDVFLVCDSPDRLEGAPPFVAATRATTNLDKLEETLRRAARRGTPVEQHLVITPQSGAASLLHVGADDHNDLVVPEESVSSGHAIILHKDGGYFVQDAGSTNGTWLNGEPVPESAPSALCSGDELRLGGIKVQFLTADAFHRLATRAAEDDDAD